MQKLMFRPIEKMFDLREHVKYKYLNLTLIFEYWCNGKDFNIRFYQNQNQSGGDRVEYIRIVTQGF